MALPAARVCVAEIEDEDVLVGVETGLASPQLRVIDDAVSTRVSRRDPCS
jgi:hypothetical protein